VNGYWMCDIGRFAYHWIESDDRLRRPLMRDANGVHQPLAWHDVMPKVTERFAAAGQANPDGVRFLLSAHAAHEEFFLFRRLTEELLGAAGPGAISVSWRVTAKSQPPHTTFVVPATDAPNVNGARIFGLVPGQNGDPQTGPDVSQLRSQVEAGQVSALYVFDPGPDGSIGDTQWIVDARLSGTLPLLIVQGVLITTLARAADFVLPGASSLEKEASYSNDQGRLQGTSRAIPTPGEALEDWQILVRLGAALGLALDYATDGDVRADIASRYAETAGLRGLSSLSFARPVAASTWLQASNPSERWKWDFMYQDLPPVKGAVDPSAVPSIGLIPLREVK
jgi:predicted molibdopterin-dependent oxidoreductase YjgC